MAVIVGSARIDEKGNARGGSAGDQTGKEVSTQNWYANTKGWYVLRAKDTGTREKIAWCMQAACDNKYIGYDQGQRDTLYNTAKQYGFDVSKVKTKVECDCSSLVRVCLAYAGISVGSFRTTNEASILLASGKFDRFTDDLHCKKSTNLLRGDILVTRTQGHTVVVLSDGSKANEEQDLTLGCRVLRKGCVGSDVFEMQSYLLELGYDLGSCGTDGDFGSATEKAVKAFQKNNGLTVNGVYGRSEHEKVLSLLSDEYIILNEDCVIRCGNGEQYAEICAGKKGATYEFVARAANGWAAVVVNEQVGWVDGNSI